MPLRLFRKRINNTMQSESKAVNSSKISLLVVDDSLVFRRFLRDIFEDCDDMAIASEAEKGIEALAPDGRVVPSHLERNLGNYTQCRK